MSRTRAVVTALVVALLTACALVVVLAKRQINLSRAYLELRRVPLSRTRASPCLPLWPPR